MIGVPTTERMALELVASPQVPVTTTSYSPASASEAAATVSIGPLASSIGVPSSRHWYESPPPLACTLKVASWPMQTSVDTGCDVIAGGSRTRTSAASLSIVPQSEVTRTV